jgi:hypothetical protein
MSVEIHLWDALQSDGKSDGRNVALCSQRKIAVRSIFELTVNFECDVQHPCGFLGDRRVGRADGKFPRSQAIARTGASRFVCGSAPSNGMKGRGRDNLPVVDLCNYIINRNARVVLRHGAPVLAEPTVRVRHPSRGPGAPGQALAKDPRLSAGGGGTQRVHGFS